MDPAQQYPTQQIHVLDVNPNHDIHIEIQTNPYQEQETNQYAMVQPYMPVPQVTDTNISMMTSPMPAYQYRENQDDNPQLYNQQQYAPEPNPVIVSQQQPEQVGNDKIKKRASRSKSLRRGESERDTYFFGILSKKHGCCVNTYRLCIAIILLPFTIIGLMFAYITRSTRRLIKCIGRCCCPAHTHSRHHAHCCHMCKVERGFVDFLIDTISCDCQTVVSTCIRCYDGTSNCCLQCSDCCGDCCTSIGTCCGSCLGWIGTGVCDCFTGAQDLCKNCLEDGKHCFTNCVSWIAKCCCFCCTVDNILKCHESAGECYSKCCQCQCDWDVCDVIHKCCECNVDLSGCGDCTGNCCGDGILDVLHCLQEVLCHLIEVLGGICESFGFVCECLECIFK